MDMAEPRERGEASGMVDQGEAEPSMEELVRNFWLKGEDPPPADREKKLPKKQTTLRKDKTVTGIAASGLEGRPSK